jgi:hypothetical protein
MVTDARVCGADSSSAVSPSASRICAGHNFGGNHAFQLGQGKTGGIMDYGDGIYPIGSGIYQFHPTYNQAEM